MGQGTRDPDVGVFTSRDSFGENVTELFNRLSDGTPPPHFTHLLVAPADLRDGLVERIRREADHARAGRSGWIIAKMNGLVDRRLIEERYAAPAGDPHGQARRQAHGVAPGREGGRASRFRQRRVDCSGPADARPARVVDDHPSAGRAVLAHWTKVQVGGRNFRD